MRGRRDARGDFGTVTLIDRIVADTLA